MNKIINNNNTIKNIFNITQSNDIKNNYKIIYKNINKLQIITKLSLFIPINKSIDILNIKNIIEKSFYYQLSLSFSFLLNVFYLILFRKNLLIHI